MTSESGWITTQDVLDATKRIQGYVRRTPVLTSELANRATQAELFFKCENLQKTGAFKFRGAYNALLQLSEAQKKKGVVAFSSGNHAQAVAFAASEMGIPSTIVMPSDAPQAKIANTRAYATEVILYDRHKEDREAIANQVMTSKGLTLIPPYDHPHVMAGQGSAAVELFEEIGPLDYLFVCVGGGGLLAGSSLAAQYFSPHCKVIGAEPEAGNDGGQSFRAGKIIKIPVPQTIADGARTQALGTLPFPIIQKYVHSFHSVTDLELCKQMRFFMEHMKIVTEPTGCLSAAVAMNHKVDLKGLKAGVIISGGNVDPDSFHEWIKKI